MIASTNPTNSKLATNKLTFEDIRNESSSSAASASISGSLKESKEKWVDNETGRAVKPNTENSTKLDSQRSGGISPGLPMFERDSDSSVTRATLTEGTIILNKDTHPTVTTAKELGINTDLAQANNQVAQTKDVKAQLQEQQQISTTIGNVKSAVDTYTSNKQEEAEQEVRRLKSRLEKAEQQGNQETVNQLKKDLMQAEAQAENWGTGGSTKRAVDAITNAGLIALSGGSSQSIATAAASPYVNQLIKKATEDYPALNIPTHILWGAVEAELMGGKASTGAISTAAGELGAKYLTEHLYNKEAKDLTETERNQVKEMAKALAGVAGGLAVAGQGSSAVKILSESSIGTTVANNAVENNYLFRQEAEEKAILMRKVNNNEATEEEKARLSQLEKLDSERDSAIINICSHSVSSWACQSLVNEAQYARSGYEQSLSYNLKFKELYPKDYQNVKNILKGKDANSVEFEKIAINWAKEKNVSLAEAKSFLNIIYAYKAFAELVGAARAGTALNYVSTKLPKGANANEKLPIIGKTKGYENQNVRISGGEYRANLYSKNWTEANLNKSIEKFAGKNPIITMTDKGKRIYENPTTKVQVVEDINGKYFRIYDPSIRGKRSYLDLNGVVPNNKTLDNGKKIGRTQSEYNQVTHFKIKE